MRPEPSTKQRSILPLFFLVLFAGAMVIGPLIFFVTRGHWPFHRVMDRALMISALAALGLAWPRLQFREWWPWRRGAVTEVLLGLLIAFISVQTILALDFACGGLTWATLTSHETAKVIRTALLAALLVPLLEETIFRGFLQTEMTRGLGWRWGWMLTALIFAVSHFLKVPNELDQQPVHGWSGVTAVGQSFGTLGHALHGVIAPATTIDIFPGKLVNLLLVGLILGGIVIRTGNLWLNYGLHGGLIIGQLLSSGLMRPARLSIWTGEDLISSPLTTIVMVVLGWWLWQFFRRPQPEPEPRSEPGANAP